MKRISTLALALLLLLSSCGGVTEETEAAADTSAVETEAETGPLTEMEKRALVKDDLPDKDFGGMQFRISTKKGTLYEIDAEELTGDLLNDALYDRNLRIEERFNVEIVPIITEAGDGNTHVNSVKQSIIAADDAFDLAATYVFTSGSIVTEGYYLNWLNMPYNDLEQVWWISGVNDNFRVGDAIYAAVGDMCLSTLKLTYGIFFNRTRGMDYGITDTIYQTVQDGEWTLDYFMSTVEDIYEIYEDLAGVGVTDLFSLYKGWQKGGLYDLPITAYKADKKIGSTKELTQLIKDAESKNISFFLYNDALRINPDEQNATFNVIKKVNKKVFEESTYKEVYDTFRYLTPTRSNTLLNRFAKSYTKQGVGNVALAGITNTLFTYTYSNVAYSRFQAADSYVKAVEELDASTKLVMEEPFAYLWKNAEAFIDMPVYMSNYLYEDESVPFLSIVLKGVMPVYADYVNFEANKEEFFLKLIETGSYPSFYITKESAADLINTNSSDIYSSQYDVYKDEILQYTSELKAVNEAVAGAVITGHQILDNGVRIVTYSNGTQIYLNYSSAAQTVDGVSIDTMSYKVVGANE